MATRTAITWLGAGALLLAACASAGAPADQGRRIEIEMRSFAFSPTALAMLPGEKVTLVLRNPDRVEHEFMAGREPMERGGYKDDLLARLEIGPKPPEGHGKGHSGVSILVPAGRTATMTFVTPAAGGAFEFACFVEGHYEAGMKGVLSIGTTQRPAATLAPLATAPSTVAPTPLPSAVAPTPTSAAPTDEHGH